MLDGMRRNAGSWIVKALFAIIIVVFIFAFGTGGFQGDTIQILAYVNEQPILIRDFQQAYERNVQAMRNQNPNLKTEDLERVQYKRQVLDQMVNTALLLDQASKLGLTVSEEEVAAAIREIPAFQNENHRFDPERYRLRLSGERMDPAEFESDMARNLLLNKLRRSLESTVVSGETEARAAFDFAKEQVVLEYALFPWKDFENSIKPTDKEIDDYYQAEQERFRVPALANFGYLTFSPATLAKPAEVSEDDVKAYYEANQDEFRQPESAKARHILIKVASNAPKAEVEKAKTKALDVLARINRGKDFAAMAGKYSQGPSSVRGGDLGWFPRGAMVEAFDKAVFAQPLNVVSKPIRTRFGWHLILVEKRRAAGLKSMDDARADIKRAIAEERAAAKVQDLLDEALEQIIAGDGLDAVGRELGLDIQASGYLPENQIAQRLGVDPDTATTLFGLTIGQTLDTPLGVKDGYILVSKADVKPSEVKPLADVKEGIVILLKQEGAMKLAKEKADQTLKELVDPSSGPAAEKRIEKILVATDPVGRRGFIPGLGLNPEMVEAAFAADTGAWLEHSFQIGQGFVLAKNVRRVGADPADWDKEKALWVRNIKRTMEDAAFSAYMADLRERAQFKIMNPDVLEY